jgi:hypothetical protein
MKRVVITFGLIAGAIMSVMMVVSFVVVDEIDFDRGEIIGYTTMVLAFLMIFFGIRSYRDNVAGGTVRFGRAFAVGTLITLVASVCYVATWQVIYHNAVPDFMERYTAHELDKARAEGATAAQLEARRADFARYAEWYRNPLINIGMTLLEVFPVGLVVTLVSAGILSRRGATSATRSVSARLPA